MDRTTAKNHIANTCGKGWLRLVDAIYDKLPENIEITDIFQKYGALVVEFEGEDKLFARFLVEMRTHSQRVCEICGQKAGPTIIDGWETTLCNACYLASDAKQKWRESDEQ